MVDNDKNISGGMYDRWKNAVSLAFSGKSIKERMLIAAHAAFFCVLAFFFSSKPLPYTSLALGAPLADALLCSASAYTPFVYVGCIFGSVHYGLMSIPRVLALTFIFVLRIITSAKNISANPEKSSFTEKGVTRLAISAIFCFVQCGMFLAGRGINAESARTVLATLIATPLLTLILSVYYTKRNDGKMMKLAYEVSMLFVFACAIYCTSDVTYAFITLDTLFCVFFTLCIAKYGGFARASLYGLILGYIASPQYCVAFLLLGASASLLFSMGVFSGCGISSAIACISAILIGGANALLSIVPETVIACAAVTPILRYAFLPKGFPYPLDDAAYVNSFSENMRCALAELSFIRSLKTASDNLREIPSAVNEVSKPISAATGATDDAVDKVCREFCEDCPLCTICHDSEKERCRMAISELLSVCSADKPFKAEDLPVYLSSHCIRLRELTDYARKNSKNTVSIKPAAAIAPLISYSSVSDIISSVYDKAESELVFDATAERSVAKLFYSAGVPFGGVSVVGKDAKKVFVYGASKAKLKKALSELEKGLNRIFGCDYSLSHSTDDKAPILFTPREMLKADAEILTACKKGEQVCGDTALTFKDGSGCFYALIADGMGSGSAACKSSSITAELIRNLMLSGIYEPLAIKLAGESLTPICDECFSTVDLMKLDLSSGNAAITKNHAAASYILRSGNVYCCNAHSLPIGINSEAAPERLELKLMDGDTVIMVSDGVAQGPQDKLRLPDLIGISSSLDARELAGRILEKACEVSGKNDDMSVLVVKISKAA